MGDSNQVLHWKVFRNYGLGVSCCYMRISTSEVTAETTSLPVISIYWQTKHCIVLRRSLLGEYKLSLDTLTAFGCLARESSDGLFHIQEVIMTNPFIFVVPVVHTDTAQIPNKLRP